MKIRIEPFTEQKSKEWDDFVWNSNTGTLFHTRQFLKYHPPERFEDTSLLFYKDTRLLALFPAVTLRQNKTKTLCSHRGSSYGGFVVKSPLSVKDAFRLVEDLLAFARENHFNSIELTPAPQIYLTRPNNYIDFALVLNNFIYKKREISSVIPLDFGVNQILTTFSSPARRAVRRAQKLNVIVKESEDYAEFYQILQTNLKLRHNVTPTHTLNELLKLKTLFPERIKLFAAFAEQKMVAGVVMFICNQKVVLAFYISHREDFQHFRGVNLLFYEIIKWAIECKYQFLDFGIFTVNMEPNWGLGRFKESFGAQGVFRDTFIKFL